MTRTLEYVVLTLLCGALVMCGAMIVGHTISASITRSANTIAQAHS